MGCGLSCDWMSRVARNVQGNGQSGSGKLSSTASEEKARSLEAIDTPEGVLDLRNFTSHEQTHHPILWFKCDLKGINAARLTASWKDQGWGNQKGAIQARVTTKTGSNKVPYPWRRIGPYPAPHHRERVDIQIPEEFFSNADDLPDDAQLELGCEVGGGGGHSLHVDSAKIDIERCDKVLFANFVEDETAFHLADLGGAVVAVVEGVTTEDARDVIISCIRNKIARQMPGEHFRVMMVGSADFSFNV